MKDVGHENIERKHMSQGWLLQKIKYIISLFKIKVTTHTHTHKRGLKMPGDKSQSFLFKNQV